MISDVKIFTEHGKESFVSAILGQLSQVSNVNVECTGLVSASIELGDHEANMQCAEMLSYLPHVKRVKLLLECCYDGEVSPPKNRKLIPA